MERNNSEVGEILTYLTLLIDMENGTLEFGDRILAEKENNYVKFSYIGDKDISLDSSVDIRKLKDIKQSLHNELSIKKAYRGQSEYYSLQALSKLIGCPQICMVAPVGRIDDFVQNGKAINFKAAIQNKAGILHYSRNFAFEYNVVGISDENAMAIQNAIRNKKISADAAAKELLSKGHLQINPSGFCGEKKNGFGFGEFLSSVNEDLPTVYQKLKSRSLETGIRYPHLLLNNKEFEIFKDFVRQINGGLNTTNFYDFKPVKMDIIIMDRKLNTIRKDLSTKEGVEWMAKHLYIDVGDASRTMAGNMRKENGTWKFTEGMYFKYERKDRV